MSTQELITVIIPVYNTGPYLRQCLESVREQTYSHMEIICVDDGSTDDSLSILREFEQNDERFRVLTSNHGGAAAARNLALDIAHGEWVIGLDSDDWLEPHAYERALSYTAEDIDIVFFSAEPFNNDGDDDPKWETIRENYARYYLQPNREKVAANPELITRTVVSPCLALRRRSIIERYNIRYYEGHIHEDEDFHFHYMAHVAHAAFTSEILYHRRLHSKSVMQNPNKEMLMDLAPIFAERIYNHYKEHNLISTCWQGVRNMIYERGYRKLDKSDVDTLLKWKANVQAMTIRCGMAEDSYLMPTLDEIFNTVHVAVITDAEYAVATAVLLTSLKRSMLPGTRYSIHIIQTEPYDGFEEHVRQLEASDFAIRILDVDITHLETVKAKTHTSVAALLKFDLCNTLAELDKVLYIDSDCITTQDLSALYHIELGNNLVAARADGAPVPQVREIMGSDGYFNSGVMLMNLKLMRKEGIASKLLETKLNLPPGCRLMDQDAFNVVCKGRTHYIPLKYNYLIILYRFYRKLDAINKFNGKQYKDFRGYDHEAVILHYASDYKPWKYVDVPGADLWMHYYMQSPYGRVALSRELNPEHLKRLKSEMEEIARKVATQLTAKQEERIPDINLVIRQVTKNVEQKFVEADNKPDVRFLIGMSSRLRFMKIRYALMEIITFGKRSQKYRTKRRECSALIREIRRHRKSNLQAWRSYWDNHN